MALIANGTTIPELVAENVYPIVVNGVGITKVIANGVVVWERKTTSVGPPSPPTPPSIDDSYAGAPPFLSAGWKTILCSEIAYWYDDDTPELNELGMVTHLFNPKDQGSAFIQENQIVTGQRWLDSHTSYEGLFFYSENIRSTSSYTRVDVGDANDWDDDESEGRIAVYTDVSTRFSNDGTNWTKWINTHKSTNKYKYAQFGIACAVESDSAVDMWYSLKIKSLTFM